MANRMAVAAAVLVYASQASAQADTTDCETPYNTADGTANCGGQIVDVKALVCGQNFNQNDCVAKWVNGGGENEWYFFMGAGAGMSGSQLPSACSSLPSGLAMVQYYPDKQECYPVADVSGTKATYKQSFGGSPTSVTLNFQAHQDSSGTVRNGYLKVTCADRKGGFTTTGDSNEGLYYEVDTSAPCSPGAPPAPPGPPVAPGDFRCVHDRCVDAGSGGGLSNATCHAVCGPKPAKFACVDSRCVRSDRGLPSEAECVEFCIHPGASEQVAWSAIEPVAGSEATPTPPPRELF